MSMGVCPFCYRSTFSVRERVCPTAVWFASVFDRYNIIPFSGPPSSKKQFSSGGAVLRNFNETILVYNIITLSAIWILSSTTRAGWCVGWMQGSLYYYYYSQVPCKSTSFKKYISIKLSKSKCIILFICNFQI